MEEKKLPFTGREKIRFNVPPFTGREYEYVRQAVENQKICGDGEFTKKASHWFEEKTGTAKCLMTTSCTHATELAAILADIKPGDEIIMPSYTFVSTANAFVLRGGVPVFVDIRPDTMNIDEKQIEAAITEKTKAKIKIMRQPKRSATRPANVGETTGAAPTARPYIPIAAPLRSGG